MILLCDEDVGTRAPRALGLVGYPAHALFDLGLAGRPDVDWLTFAGREGYLVFSRNYKMLTVRSERETITNEKVGIVFLTSGEESPAMMLRLLLNRWDALDFLDRNEPRPFARFLTPRGHLSNSFNKLQLP